MAEAGRGSGGQLLHEQPRVGRPELALVRPARVGTLVRGPRLPQHQCRPARKIFATNQPKIFDGNDVKMIAPALGGEGGLLPDHADPAAGGVVADHLHSMHANSDHL